MVRRRLEGSEFCNGTVLRLVPGCPQKRPTDMYIVLVISPICAIYYVSFDRIPSLYFQMKG